MAEKYGKTKVADDFVISDHAVGITLHGSGLARQADRPLARDRFL
ncbi:hypothetical protein [Modestobacter marinus]|nr:hypothetical protein [Modestobacter marinus]